MDKTITSAILGASSTATAFNGDVVMSWVLCGINIAILISNAIIDIYRKFRDRDDDKKDKT